MADYQAQTIDGLDDIEAYNTPIDDLASAECFLLFVGIDESGSMDPFVDDMKTALNNFKDSISNSKESDIILIARADFNEDVDISGYKTVNNFETKYSCGGRTKLYDTIVEGKQRLLDYIGHLKTNGMQTRAVFSIFSDGEDNSSSYSLSDAAKAIEELKKQEIATAIIGFGSEAANIGNKLGIKSILNVGTSSSELRKAFNMLSKSAISTSKAAGSAQDAFKF
jgi:hypothetical protein